MDLETINVEKIEKVAIIKLNRPELLNAVNEQLVWDFQKATESVKNDESIRVVIITGSGEDFQQVLILAKERQVGRVLKMLL